ncbi:MULTISPECIES: aldehyde dehydrogenase family protein [Thermomonosporaceae]|uniref:aldehyde dehydrogenase family protein n=1 Tax=Thermomonosporaceae TaxID=2012 RepID=UPI00255B158F|nr:MULTISPECIES: aldehyde dehydrogenase family protein [Thermomonosporaceae]MDL4772540.1 aldehyde dehydrogenase family protein [Actinomadura xylanilytica]
MGREITVRDPRTGRSDHTLTCADPGEVGAAAARARAAQPGWLALGVPGRVAALRALRDALAERGDAMVAALVRDTGRLPVSRLEVDSVLASLDRWCDQAPGLLAGSGAAPTSMPGIEHRPGPLPYPLVGAISPWNFPLLLAMIDVVPALLAGSAVLVKPSEVTPRFAAVMRECATAVPALDGVLGFVDGDGTTGAALVGSVDLICFTGSVRTGRAVGAAAAARFIPAFLELGGKDPAIVLTGADLDRAAAAILWGGTVNTGHSCMSIERVYVAEEVFEEFVGLLVARARRVGLAYPEVTDGELGPVISAAQTGIITDQIADAVAHGATVHCGGTVRVLGGGEYLEPTVLTGVDHSMRIMREETFGPVLPVLPFADADEAVALANDSEFGLSAAVFAGTTEAALAVGARLEAGGISVNDAALTGLVQDGEKNAFKSSGLGGSRMGAASIRRFLRQRSFLIRDPATSAPWWFA